MRFSSLSGLACAIFLFACGEGREDGGHHTNLIQINAPLTTREATLFSFDDVSIPFRKNLYLQMVSARKHLNNPVVERGAAGTPDDHDVKFNGSVIRHDGKFKMWYVAIDREGIESVPVSQAPTRVFSGYRVAYAESEDGIHWTKPKLGLVEYRGNKDNNLVLIDPPEIRGNHLVVLYEPEDPDPSRRFKMMRRIRGFPPILNTTIPLYSPDGLRWRSAVELKLVDYGLPDENLVFPENFEQSGLYRWQGVYFLTGQQIDPWVWLPDGQPAGRAMTVFRSADFENWSATKALGFVRYGYRPDPPGHGREAHLAGSTWNRGSVLLATYGLWHGAPEPIDRRLDIGLLISNDGIHFREPEPDFVLIASGEDGNWDEGGLLTGQGFENAGNETLIYYGHWDLRFPHTVEREAGRTPKPGGGVGLAVLERDRFGFLTPRKASEAASLITGPLEIPPDTALHVNAAGLSGESRLRIEMLDVLERPLPAYSGNNAAIVTESGLSVPVDWSENPATDARGQTGPVRIRISFEGSERESIRFYALYIRMRIDQSDS